MKLNRMLFFLTSALLILALGAALPAAAQESNTGEGVNSGNYNIKQTAEFGYRWADTTGNRDVYNTFVNLNQGPRLLDYTLEMRSLNHQGWLFDNFYVSNFGYGGDPNDVTRLRAYKNKWYNFSGTFRRDRNFWDYNILANPLNPPTTFTPLPAGFTPLIPSSPHRMETTRRMSDFNLTVMPQSPVRLRLGYSRNISEGPSWTSFHEGTDVLLFQPWKATLNSYNVGVDFKVLPRTNISYDQFLYYYKGDTTWSLNSTPFLVTPPVGAQIPVDIGLPFNTPANQPCAVPFVRPAPPPVGVPGPSSVTAATVVGRPPDTQVTVNPVCNGYFSYNTVGRVRTTYPTEQLSFQSNYFKNVDFSGRISYSAGDNDLFGFNEAFSGLVTRTRQRQFTKTGPASGRRVAVTADGAITVHVTDKFRFSDTFRFQNFRIPGRFVLSETSFFPVQSPTPTGLLSPLATFSSAACPSPDFTAAACPEHNASSPADIISSTSSLFLGQNSKWNTFELAYDFTRRVGGRLGYRYGRRTITHGDSETQSLTFFPNRPARGACALVGGVLPANCTQDPVTGVITGTTAAQDSDTTEINEHSVLVAIWARPVDELRWTFDVELLSADRALTRISPRNQQRYKSRINWKPVDWVSVGASLNILERRDNVTDIFHKQHNRSYGFSLAMEPKPSFGFDVGYDYNDVFSTTNICYVLGFGPPPAGSPPCPVVGGQAPIAAISLYTNKTEFGYADVHWKPIKRLSTNLGFAISSVSGNTLILMPNAPPGPLQFTYYKPYAGFAVELYKGLYWKAAWNFYQYNEKAVPDPFTTSRFFRSNMVTNSIRFVF